MFVSSPFEEFFSSWPSPTLVPWNLSPDGRVQTRPLPVDITESEEGYLLECDVPGSSLNDIWVFVEDDHLVIRAARPKPQVSPAETLHRRERLYADVERTFFLPKDAWASGLCWSVDCGVLSITLPKRTSTAVPTECFAPASSSPNK